MAADLKNLLRAYKSVSIIGICKNAGKTTVLNALISAYSGTVLGITSAGRDGETSDIVTGTHKPRIYLNENTLAATASGLLPLCSVTREILSATGISTPLGEVVVFRARGDGFAELAGPSMASQLESLCEILSGYGAEKIIVDGALSRRAQSVVTESVILSSGAAAGHDMDTVISDTAFVCRLFSLPIIFDQGKALEIKGALTDTVLKSLLSSKKPQSIAVEDPAKILTSRAATELFWARGGTMFVKKAVKLAGVSVNPVSPAGWVFDKKEFQEKMAAAVNVPVFNVGY